MLWRRSNAGPRPADTWSEGIVELPADAPPDTDVDASVGFDVDFTTPDGPENAAPPSRNIVQAYEDEMLAIQQGASPIVRALDDTYHYERASQAEQNRLAETGTVSDRSKYVALRDPQTGKLDVWLRNKDMSESGLLRFGRLTGLGAPGPLRAGTQPANAAAWAKRAGHNATYAAANGRFATWAGDILSGKAKAGNKLAKVGGLDADVQAFLKSKGITPQSAEITVLDKRLTLTPSASMSRLSVNETEPRPQWAA